MVKAPPSLAAWHKRDLLLVLGLGLLSVVLWRLPAVGWLFYPFQLYNTFVHELSHGIAAVVTGGSFHRFVVHADLSGTAWSAGGIPWIVSSAGYVGSTLLGGWLTILSARGVPARWVLRGLGFGLGIMCLLFVRNIFGVMAGLVLAGALFAAGRYLRRPWDAALLLLLAVQMMLNALDSVLDLLRISTSTTEALTDARIMAAATGVPALIWALLWSAISVAILWFSLWAAYRRTADGRLPRPGTPVAGRSVDAIDL